MLQALYGLRSTFSAQFLFHCPLGKLSAVHLVHACEETVVEWVELVSDFLQRDWSEQPLDQLKPVPSEEFAFWRNRLKNLLFIQNQGADSVYWTALQDLQCVVQEGVREAEDIMVNLAPVQEKLSEVLEMDFYKLNVEVSTYLDSFSDPYFVQGC
ncbi:hypothetical protein XENOCAPTIV_009832 [Xenoophorus captivus]|uniref:Dynein heavy chain tail domain-containing protein n=1 Tax=Xenoophorus captivus TaxID=1517983 RepID=A0ABV0QSA9_9TELE